MQSWIICSNKMCCLGNICFHGYQHRLEHRSLWLCGMEKVIQVGGSVKVEALSLPLEKKWKGNEINRHEELRTD